MQHLHSSGENCVGRTCSKNDLHAKFDYQNHPSCNNQLRLRTSVLTYLISVIPLQLRAGALPCTKPPLWKVRASINLHHKVSDMIGKWIQKH